MNNISRRSLAKGVAWSAPVIAATTTIPAYAASICSTTNATTGINWSTFRRDQAPVAGASTQFTGRATTSDGISTVNITHTSSTGSSLDNAQDLLYKGTTSQQRGIQWATYAGFSDYLYLQTVKQGVSGYSGGSQASTLTFSFTTPVKNFTFTVGDVDMGSTASGGPWQDILVASSPYRGSDNPAPTATGNATVTQNATSTTVTATQNAIDYKSTAGNVTFTFAGPLDSITLVWRNGQNRTGAQNIVIDSTTTNVCNGR